MKEDTRTITEWANATFGRPATNLSIAKRAAAEMKEMLDMLETNDNDPKAPREAADIVIVLQRIFSAFGTTQDVEVDAKMAINRARKWRLSGDGHGQHIEEPPPASGRCPEHNVQLEDEQCWVCQRGGVMR